MKKAQITQTQNTLKKLKDAVITKHLSLNQHLNADEENVLMQRAIKTLCFYLEKIKKDL